MEIMLYPILIIVPFLLKDSFIDKLESSKNQIVRQFEGQVRRGERFYSQIMFIRPGADYSSLTQYKFFNEIVENILNYANIYGAPTTSALNMVKKSLLADISRQRILSKCISSALSSFIVASIITWAFGYYSTSIMSIETSPLLYLGVLLWQFGGVFTYQKILKYLQMNRLKIYDPTFKCIYTIQSLSQVGLCVNDVIDKSKLINLYEIKNSKLVFHLQRLEQILEERKNQGSPILDELEIYIEQTWELFDQEARKYEKQATVLKFLWLCIFYFSTYLFMIFLLLNQMSMT